MYDSSLCNLFKIAKVLKIVQMPTKKNFMRKSAIIVMIVGGAISIILQLLFPSGPSTGVIPNELKGILLPQAKPLQPFTLTDHNKKPFDVTGFENRWSFLFFGYTHCPDICPTALGELATVFENLSQNETIMENSQAVFVSIDPERDTPESLKEYVSYFHPKFIGVTGGPQELKKFTKQLGATYILSPKKEEEGEYQVFHTSAVFLINPKGEFSAIFQPSMSNPDKITQSYLKIREIYQGEHPK
ncbi:MAG: SCO family protein [Magnetococcales bacterium]|nr:SCO family protein [Magnetococcales bacterium]